MLLDAGGVLVLPNRGLVRDALAPVGIEIDPERVPRAHYEAVRRLDRLAEPGTVPDGYVPAFCSALGISAERLADATAAISRLADREASGQILWSEPAPHAQSTIGALQAVGIAVLVVTNSDGHAAINLRDAAICHTEPGAGACVRGVLDSGVLGRAKPDPEIFAIALSRVHAQPRAAVHVGDMLCSDVAGARAAGLVAIHLDPYRACRARDHPHIRSLKGIWRHVSPARGRVAVGGC